MNKYTPGQWTTRSNCVQVVAEQEDDYTIIADVRCPTQIISGQINYDEHLPNLRLIAAAPDLLAACEAAHEWLVSYFACYPEPIGKEINVGMKLQDAINKAKGDTP